MPKLVLYRAVSSVRVEKMWPSLRCQPCSAMPGTGAWIVCMAFLGAMLPRSPLMPFRRKLRHEVPAQNS